MRKLLTLIATLLFLALPVFAQRGGQRPQRQPQRQPRFEQHQRPERPVARPERGRPDRGQVDRVPERGESRHVWGDRDRYEGYHYDRHDVHGGANKHWRGDRFDDHFYRGHYGPNHRFFWGRCNWYGPRFYPGSYFWYDGAYFVIIDQAPAYWYDDDTEVVIIFDDGFYYMVNPMYPGVRYHVDVRF